MTSYLIHSFEEFMSYLAYIFIYFICGFVLCLELSPNCITHQTGYDSQPSAYYSFMTCTDSFARNSTYELVGSVWPSMSNSYPSTNV